MTEAFSTVYRPPSRGHKPTWNFLSPGLGLLPEDFRQRAVFLGFEINRAFELDFLLIGVLGLELHSLRHGRVALIHIAQEQQVSAVVVAIPAADPNAAAGIEQLGAAMNVMAHDAHLDERALHPVRELNEFMEINTRISMADAALSISVVTGGIGVPVRIQQDDMCISIVSLAGGR